MSRDHSGYRRCCSMSVEISCSIVGVWSWLTLRAQLLLAGENFKTITVGPQFGALVSCEENAAHFVMIGNQSASSLIIKLTGLFNAYFRCHCCLAACLLRLNSIFIISFFTHSWRFNVFLFFLNVLIFLCLPSCRVRLLCKASRFVFPPYLLILIDAVRLSH